MKEVCCLVRLILGSKHRKLPRSFVSSPGHAAFKPLEANQLDPPTFGLPLQRPTEIYGPSGLREFMRCNLRLTQSILTRPYVVHELLFEGEEEETGKLHPSEREGRSIRQVDGVWKDFTTSAGVNMSAGPILHTGQPSFASRSIR